MSKKEPWIDWNNQFRLKTCAMVAKYIAAKTGIDLCLIDVHKTDSSLIVNIDINDELKSFQIECRFIYCLEEKDFEDMFYMITVFRTEPRKIVEPTKYDFTYCKLTAAWGPNGKNFGGFRISYGAKGVGFGSITFVRKGDRQDEDGDVVNQVVECDNEQESPEFVEAVLREFLKSVKMRDV